MKFASRYLWLLHQESIDKAELIFAHNDPEARAFSTQHIKQCINPPATASTALGNPTGGPETFVQLTSEISKFAESNARSNALRVNELEKADEKKNRLGKWVYFSNKLMLLNMMSDCRTTESQQQQIFPSRSSN
eukprot:scaffold32762_cov17-Cyclotella_meneghiniana.AAC.1